MIDNSINNIVIFYEKKNYCKILITNKGIYASSILCVHEIK